MRRRDFVTGLLVVIAAGRAQAQQPAKVYRIAVVSSATPPSDMSETGTRPLYRAFFSRLRQLGYIEGQNLSVERYSLEGRTEHFEELAARVVRSNPDLIFPSGPSALTRAFKSATSIIPIVTVTGDPVASGIASSLARPGGNVTGFTSVVMESFVGKQLELLKQAVPTISRVAFLRDPANPIQQLNPSEISDLEKVLKLKLQILTVGKPEDIESAFLAAARERADALWVGVSPLTWRHRTRIAELAAKNRLSAVYYSKEYVEAGGLLSFGPPNTIELYPRAASYVDKILKGANPAELPVQQPSKFELVINLKTAKSLGLTIPPSLLARADQVIE